MKIRSGFVSNSSSSSFIAIAKSKDQEIQAPILPNNRLVIPRNLSGETEFGSDRRYFYDFDSKLNFLILQALYADSKDCLDLIYQAIKLKYEDIEDIKLNLRRDFIDYDEETSEESEKLHFGYIDHESIGGGFLELFEGENLISLISVIDKIYNFLFMEDSFLYMNRDEIEDELDKIDKENYWIFTSY